VGPSNQPDDDPVRHADEVLKKLEEVAEKAAELPRRLEEAETEPLDVVIAPIGVEDDDLPGAAAVGPG
jgi:hypothetical protein